MIDPSGQPAQTPGETVPPAPHVSPDIDISAIPTIESLMAPTPNTPISAEIPQTASDPSLSIPEDLTIGLPEAPQNILSNNTITAPTRKFQHILMPVIVLFIIVVGISSIAYAYVNKIGPFGSSTYTETNFSSSILEKISAIKSASYTFSAALDVVPREADASPFIFKSQEGKESFFLTKMSDSMSMIPPDVKGKVAVTASSEVMPQSMTNWSFNFDAEGDMSDMTYKINADISKIDANYYFKVNNFPGLALFEIAAPLKGKWVVIPSAPVAETTPSIPKENTLTESVQDSVKSGEESFKKNRDMVIKVIKKITLVADREKLLVFKSAPRLETIDGKKFTRYELSIKKDNLQAFYTGLIAEIQNDPELLAEIDNNRGLTTDEQKKALRLKEEASKKEVEDYLKKEEFTQIFDYIEKNNSFILWTDADGFPAIIQNTMRVVPADTAERLKDKQITLVYKLVISNINVPIVLTAPTDAVSWETISKELNPTNKSKMEETTIIAGLSSINTIATSVYTTEGSYGKKGVGLGPCKPTVDTLFANTYIIEELNRLTNNDMSLATCAARGRQGKVGLWAISVPLQNEPGFSYCIDTTTSKKITGNLKGLACK